MLSLQQGMGLGWVATALCIECYHHFLSNGLPVAEETQLKQEDVKFVEGNGAWVKNADSSIICLDGYRVLSSFSI
jgi:hypothetical protein